MGDERRCMEHCEQQCRENCCKPQRNDFDRCEEKNQNNNCCCCCCQDNNQGSGIWLIILIIAIYLIFCNDNRGGLFGGLF